MSADLKLNFEDARARKWKNKETGECLKVHPWFLPIGESKLDFKGVLKDIAPELFSDDVAGNFNVYSGLILQAGWLIENKHGVTAGLPLSISEYFEDVGYWTEEATEQQKQEQSTDETV